MDRNPAASRSVPHSARPFLGNLVDHKTCPGTQSRAFICTREFAHQKKRRDVRRILHSENHLSQDDRGRGARALSSRKRGRSRLSGNEHRRGVGLIDATCNPKAACFASGACVAHGLLGFRHGSGRHDCFLALRASQNGRSCDFKSFIRRGFKATDQDRPAHDGGATLPHRSVWFGIGENHGTQVGLAAVEEPAVFCGADRLGWKVSGRDVGKAGRRQDNESSRVKRVVGKSGDRGGFSPDGFRGQRSRLPRSERSCGIVRSRAPIMERMTPACRCPASRTPTREDP